MNTLKLNKTNKQTGFTIIEVVLVLAIAGLIFLMVFIALPALQRGQRDAQRKNDLGRVLTAVQNYQSNNRGAIPDGSWSETLDSYLNKTAGEFKDPDGSNYVFRSIPAGDPITEFKNGVGNTLIAVHYYGKCGEAGSSVSAGGRQMVALSIMLESGGVYCVNN
jgi:prepilin-type N-terminal cleavage/methylation domain-containing protein